MANGRRAVVFDVDGVLVDSLRPHYDTWRQTAERCFERTLDFDEFVPGFGMTMEGAMRFFWPDWKFSASDVQRFTDVKEGAYRELIRERLPVMPGAPELVSALVKSGRFALAIGSSGVRSNVEIVRKWFDTAVGGTAFAAVVTGDDVAHGKPNPEVFQRAAAALGLPPTECVVIEDAAVGIQAAKAAGARVVALTSTSPRLDLTNADLVVDNLDELSPDRLWKVIGLGATAAESEFPSRS